MGEDLFTLGTKLTPLFNCNDSFSSHSNSAPDVYVIGFQEIVDLNPKTVVFRMNSSQVDGWSKLITTELAKIGA